MTVSYVPGNALTRARDAVRLLIHDTDSDRELLDDDEIDFFLDTVGLTGTSDPTTGNYVAVRRAAAAAARAIAAKFASETQVGISEVSGSARDTAAQYEALANLLHQDSIPWLLR